MKLLRLELAQLGQVHPVDKHPVEPCFHVLEPLLIADHIFSQGAGHSAFSY